jgi:hypothetical protein
VKSRLRKKAQIKVKAEQMKELEAAKKQMLKPKRGVDSTDRKFKASTPPQRRSLSSLGVVVSDEEKARCDFLQKTLGRYLGLRRTSYAFTLNFRPNSKHQTQRAS